MARSVVTVGEFPNAMLAELARGRLAEEGIEAEVSGAMAQSWGGGEVPMTGVKVEVLREDFDRARAILDEVESHLRPGADAGAEAEVEDGEGEEDDADEGGEEESPAEAVAAADGSWTVERTKRAIHGALVVTLLSWVFMPLLALAVALVAHVLIRRGPEPWTAWMRVAFTGTLVVAAALAAYSIHVLTTHPEYWLVPWPWFQTDPPWGTPDP